MEKLYTDSKNKTGSSDHELLIAKFKLKLKKVRNTTRPFRYDIDLADSKVQLYLSHCV